jgi:hypothetical protein
VILPKWIDLFAVDVAKGEFSFYPKDKTPTLYGTIDVTHVLGSVGQLNNFTKIQKDAWATTINSYQIAETGFYKTVEHAPGHQPYHGAGEATASLALLGRKPAFNNSVFIKLAQSTEADWFKFFDPLYNGTTCYKSSLHGNNIHSCGQIIGSVPSVLAYTTGSEHIKFLTWWAAWIANNTDSRYGVLCPVDGSETALYACLGGGMATHGIELGLGLGFNLSNPAALLKFALKMQSSTGYWSGDAGSMSLDGIFQLARSSIQLGRAEWDSVKGACVRLLAAQEKNLNDEDHVMSKYGSKSHDLANAVANVAECATHFPELVVTRRTWSCCARYV